MKIACMHVCAYMSSRVPQTRAVQCHQHAVQDLHMLISPEPWKVASDRCIPLLASGLWNTVSVPYLLKKGLFHLHTHIPQDPAMPQGKSAKNSWNSPWKKKKKKTSRFFEFSFSMNCNEIPGPESLTCCFIIRRKRKKWREEGDSCRHRSVSSIKSCEMKNNKYGSKVHVTGT